jgi:hypothetical protein
VICGSVGLMGGTLAEIGRGLMFVEYLYWFILSLGTGSLGS